MAKKISELKDMRIDRIIHEYIAQLNLNLEDLTVFTEAASGNYIYNPLVACLAGAKKVYGYTYNSEYGCTHQVWNDFGIILDTYGISNFEFVHRKHPDEIRQCDIITNSGLIRPIDEFMVQMMKPSAVIPLMYEPWELRRSDIDLDVCREKGIMVMGTNEQDFINLFPTSGYLVLKRLFEMGNEIYGDKIAVIGHNIIAENINCVLMHLGIELTVSGKPVNHDDFDAVIYADEKGEDYITKEGTRIIYIGRNTSALGPKYVIALFAMGLKVGECMARCQQNGMSYKDTIEYCMKHSPALPMED